MRGLVLEGVGRIAVRDDLAEPLPQEDTDAVVALTRSGLCGSDLHTYEGREPARPGVIGGHEIVGTVVATGDAVSQHRPGDRVLAAFTTSCGTCDPCRRGLSARCIHGAFFGYGAPDPDAVALDGARRRWSGCRWPTTRWSPSRTG
jgi:alcohol dehydrogenase